MANCLLSLSYAPTLCSPLYLSPISALPCVWAVLSVISFVCAWSLFLSPHVCTESFPSSVYVSVVCSLVYVLICALPYVCAYYLVCICLIYSLMCMWPQSALNYVGPWLGQFCVCAGSLFSPCVPAACALCICSLSVVTCLWSCSILTWACFQGIPRISACHPVWMLTECLSFGYSLVSLFYCNQFVFSCKCLLAAPSFGCLLCPVSCSPDLFVPVWL